MFLMISLLAIQFATTTLRQKEHNDKYPATFEYADGWILVYGPSFKVTSELVSVSRLCLHVAVKVLKSGDGFTQAGQDELALLRCVSGLLFVSPQSPPLPLSDCISMIKCIMGAQLRTEGEIVSLSILPHIPSPFPTCPHNSPRSIYFTLVIQVSNAHYFYVLLFYHLLFFPCPSHSHLMFSNVLIRQVVLQAVTPLVEELFSCWMSLS